MPVLPVAAKKIPHAINSASVECQVEAFIDSLCHRHRVCKHSTHSIGETAYRRNRLGRVPVRVDDQCIRINIDYRLEIELIVRRREQPASLADISRSENEDSWQPFSFYGLRQCVYGSQSGRIEKQGFEVQETIIRRQNR